MLEIIETIVHNKIQFFLMLYIYLLSCKKLQIKDHSDVNFLFVEELSYSCISFQIPFLMPHSII